MTAGRLVFAIWLGNSVAWCLGFGGPISVTSTETWCVLISGVIVGASWRELLGIQRGPS
jgi:hypothetical protein